MSGDVGSASHFNQLMEIARQYRVKVHFLERSVASEVRRGPIGMGCIW